MADDDVTRAKSELRARLRAERRSRYGGTDGARRRLAEGRELLTHAGPLLELVTARITQSGRCRVAAFHPTPTEADVMPLAAALVSLGAEVVFPAEAGAELEWIAWDGQASFVPSAGKGFGKEPPGPRLGTDALAGASLVLAPALAVDRGGARIGHGAGYYDRALLHLPPDSPVVAVIHPAELLPAGTVPRERHDLPVGAVLTAHGLHRVEGQAAPASHEGP